MGKNKKYRVNSFVIKWNSFYNKWQVWYSNKCLEEFLDIENAKKFALETKITNSNAL